MDYLEQLNITQYATCCGFLDRRAECYAEMPVPVYPPERAEELKPDYVVVAMLTSAQWKRIEACLLSVGIEREKIVFGQFRQESPNNNFIDILADKFIKTLTNDKKILYIIGAASMGDNIIACSLITEVLKRKKKKAAVLIALDRYRHMDIDFVGVIDKIFISDEIMRMIRVHILKNEKYESDNYIFAHPPLISKTNEYVPFDGLPLVDYYKMRVLKIPIDSRMYMPFSSGLSKNALEEIHSKYIIDDKRTIVLIKYARDRKMLSDDFWQNLVRIISKQGYIIYTNVNPDLGEVPVENTMPMFTTLSEIQYISNKVKCFIGLRCGLLDLLCTTKAKVIAIDNELNNDCELERSFSECDCKTMYYWHNYKDEICKKNKIILDERGGHTYNKQDIIVNGINLSRVFFDEEDLMKGVLKKL